MVDCTVVLLLMGHLSQPGSSGGRFVKALGHIHFESSANRNRAEAAKTKAGGDRFATDHVLLLSHYRNDQQYTRILN